MKRSHLFLVGLVAILSVSSLSYGWVFTTHYNSVVHLARDPFISSYFDKYDLSVSLVSAISAVEPPEASQWGFCNNIDENGSLVVDYGKWPMGEVSVGRIIHMAMDCSVPSNHSPAGLLGFQSDGAEILVEGLGMFGRMPGSYPVCGADMTYKEKRDIFYNEEVDIVNDYKAWYNGHGWLHKLLNPPFGYYDRGVTNGMTLAHAVLYDYFQIYDPDRGYGSGHRGGGTLPPFDCPAGDRDMPADADGLDTDPDRIDMNPFETLDGQLEMFPSILGDANGDGVVDVTDYTSWANNFGTGDDWSEGDFDLDGVITSTDYVIWANYYGVTMAGAPGVTPEPTTLSLLGLGVLAILRRRK